MSVNLGKLSLSVLHTKRLPRPSQTYNASCPDRGAVRFTIHVCKRVEESDDEDEDMDDSEATNEEAASADAPEADVCPMCVEDSRVTEVIIRFHAPQHPEYAFAAYVDRFQPIIRAGMQALFEYAYEYGMRRTGRALRFEEGTIENWTHPVVEAVATNTATNTYVYGKEWQAINFDDGLWLPEPLPGGGAQAVPTEFMKMCGVVIDRMCTSTCSVLRPPVFRRDAEGEYYDGEPERLTCCVLLCAANGLGYEAWRASKQCDRGPNVDDPAWASLS